MFERAAALQPRDSIILANVVETTSEAAFRDLIGKRLDLAALRVLAEPDFLHYLYRDRAGRDRIIAEVKGHPGVARALAQAERLRLLTPKGSHPYRRLFSLHGLTRDADALRRLDAILGEVELDHSDLVRLSAETYAGKNE